MVKTNSVEVGDVKLVSNVINSVNTYVPSIESSLGSKYPLTEIRINLKEGRVFVVWEDFSEEEARTNTLIAEYTALKAQLTDPLTQPTLFKQLIDIANEFKQLTNMNIEEVVG